MRDVDVQVGQSGLARVVSRVYSDAKFRDVGPFDRLRWLRVLRNWSKTIKDPSTGEFVTVGEAFEHFVVVRAVAESVLSPETVTVDWEKLADFLERILPLIIEFVKALVAIFSLL